MRRGEKRRHSPVASKGTNAMAISEKTFGELSLSPAAQPIPSDGQQDEHLEWKQQESGIAALNCPLVMSCDNNYAMPLATALRSIAEAHRNRWPLEVCVFSDGFAKDSARRVMDSQPKDSIWLRWVTVDLALFNEFATLPYISKATYARLLIPRALPQSVSRVLYLDADILVLNDLGELCEMDLEGAVVGAVLDHGLDANLKRGEPRFKDVPRVQDYFNAGVLLIDLDRWRSEQITEKALQYLIDHPHSPFSDQDALNVACDRRWKHLNTRWNYQTHTKTDFSALPQVQLPAIVHFVLDSKPWNARIPNVNAHFYDAYRSRTRFSRTSWERLVDMGKGLPSRAKRGLRRWLRLMPT